MKVEISNGELIDKFTIIEIKLMKINDKSKLENISKEYNILNKLIKPLFEQYCYGTIDLDDLYLELTEVNQILWDIEDKIREHEKLQLYDKKFIELARLVYITNDKRSEIKKKINLMTNSIIIEEKSYSEY